MAAPVKIVGAISMYLTIPCAPHTTCGLFVERSGTARRALADAYHPLTPSLIPTAHIHLAAEWHKRRECPVYKGEARIVGITALEKCKKGKSGDDGMGDIS